MPYPIAVAIAPMMKIYRPDISLLDPMIAALMKPREKNSTAPITIAAIQGWVLCFMMPEVTIQGITGRMPKIKKAKKVMIPHLIARMGSTTASPNSSSIMMLTKACLLVEQSTEMRCASSREKPLSVQMSIISFFSSSSRWSTSYSSLSSSDLMKSISALADRQSPRPIPIASPTQIATQRASIVLASVPEEKLLRITMSVLVEPSTPPYIMDFRSSPISICSSSCLNRSSRVTSTGSMSILILSSETAIFPIFSILIANNFNLTQFQLDFAVSLQNEHLIIDPRHCVD